MKIEYIIETCLPEKSKEWFGRIRYSNKKEALKDMKQFRKNHDESNNPKELRVTLRLSKITNEIIKEL